MGLDLNHAWHSAIYLSLLLLLFELIVVFKQFGIGILQLGQGVSMREGGSYQ